MENSKKNKIIKEMQPLVNLLLQTNFHKLLRNFHVATLGRNHSLHSYWNVINRLKAGEYFKYAASKLS